MRYILCTILFGLIACNEPVSDKNTKPIHDQKKFATVKLTDLNGQPISLDQFKGRTIFLNFWATWCKPCIREMPSIDSAQRLLSKNGVVFLLASDETPEQIKEFKEHYQFDLNFVRLTNMEELTMDGLPTTYIYNPKGEKVFAETGYRNWNDSSNIKMILQINNQK
ncbi:MAG: TlpA family protein disulfide reductase [Bacteroidetes bacterium]|nr:TlpA family protein disulfide reductase [Bacteroidota bacterium]